jgi:thiol-disulfide isomerase/thioredoxin
MRILKSGPDKDWGCRLPIRRMGMAAGLLVVLLIALTPAGSRWSSFPVASSQESQGSQGNDAAYDTEFRKGLDLLRRHRWEDALKSFKRANEMRNKQSAECFYGMAQAYQGLEAYKNVAENCDKAIELSAGDPKTLIEAYNLKGIALQALAAIKDQKKLQEAEAVFRQALALGTNLPILHYNLGYTLLEEGRDPEGIAELKKFTELEGEGAKAEEARKLIENPRRAREAYAPDFSFTTSEGEYLSLDDLRGKVVLLDFWGTWCPPCVASVPSLRDLNKRYAKEKSFVMISVSVHDEEDKWRAFTSTNQMLWPQCFDRDSRIQRAFSVNRFPTYILIDHEGIMRFRVSGMSFEREASLNDAIHKQIKILEKPAPSN